jgi:hypothetical protein
MGVKGKDWEKRESSPKLPALFESQRESGLQVDPEGAWEESTLAYERK